MTVEKTLNLNLSQIQQKVLAVLPPNFDSHDFILKFAHNFQLEYIELLDEYKKFNNPFQECHKQIGKWLSINNLLLNIKSKGQVSSKNIFGETNSVEKWEKI